MPLETHDTIWTLTGYKMILKPLSILPLKKKKKITRRSGTGLLPQSYGDGVVSTGVSISWAFVFFFLETHDTIDSTGYKTNPKLTALSDPAAKKKKNYWRSKPVQLRLVSFWTVWSDRVVNRLGDLFTGSLTRIQSYKPY